MKRPTRLDEANRLAVAALELERHAKASGNVAARDEAGGAAGRAMSAAGSLEVAAAYDKDRGGGSSEARSLRSEAARYMRQARDHFARAQAALR